LDTPTAASTSLKDIAKDGNVQQSGVGIFGVRNWVYKAFSEKDSRPYVLRRLEGYRLSAKGEGSMISYIERWRKLRNPSLVSVIEAFTTKAFGDSCQSNLNDTARELLIL